jgi:hypothetical protein
VLLCGPLHYHPPVPRRPVEAALTAFFVAMHARFMRELAMLPPGVEVVVFNGGGDPSVQYRDFSATAALIEEGRAEVAEVLGRYAGTSQDLTPHRPPPAPSSTPNLTPPPIPPLPIPTPISTPTPATEAPASPAPTTRSPAPAP